MKKALIVLGVLAIFFIAACDVIEAPYLDTNKPVWNGRKILLLDFTGHTCGNCPGAHRTIEELRENMSNAIVPIAVHCGYFSVVYTTNVNQPYHYDFRNPVSLELGGNGFSDYGYFGIQSQPIGVVNRLVPEALAAHDAWGAAAAEYFSLFPELLIEGTAAFNETDSMVNTQIEVSASMASTRNLHLAVFITESHILQWQTDYTQNPSNVQNYEHNHVLRGSFNGTWGEAINSDNASINRNQEFSKSYSLKIANDWNSQNLSVVAFVYDSDTKEVLQAEEIHVTLP